MMPYKIDPEVLSAVQDERVYQNRKWGTTDHHPHEVGGYLTIIRKLSADADAAWSSARGDIAALDEVRKIIAVGIACLEQHGPVPRSPMAFVAPQGGHVPHDAQ